MAAFLRERRPFSGRFDWRDKCGIVAAEVMDATLAPPPPLPGLPGDETALTAAALIRIEYIAPSATLAPFVTTLYHFCCDELTIRDIQPAAIGQLCLFPYGKGELHFAEGHRDPNHPVGLLTPLSRATPMFVEGPFHAFGAALTPIGWAALTGLHAGQFRDRLLPAGQVLGPAIDDLGQRLLAAYRNGAMTGPACAQAIGNFIETNLRPINPRHLELIAATGRWLSASFNPEVGELAGVAGYSARQVQRLVERYFGLPPRALARKYRALRAAALLSGPQLSLEAEAEIAEAFFDQSHMIREIAHFVGRTPARLTDTTTPYLAEMIDSKNLRELES
jgi:AraC-like DNA-binding protein